MPLRDVIANANSEGPLYSVPSGGIILWSGSIATIPGGWALCDGSLGTPNLRDKFVVGAGGAYNVDSLGGETAHLLTAAESGLTSHAHLIAGQAGNQLCGNFGGSTPTTNWYNANNYITNGSPTTAMGNATSAAASAHNTLPPYYALCYIMKL